jgi:hypothetical protein
MTRRATRESEAGFIIPSTIQQRTQAAHRHPDSQDPAWRIWKTLNPDEEPLVHLRLEVPTVVASDTLWKPCAKQYIQSHCSVSRILRTTIKRPVDELGEEPDICIVEVRIDLFLRTFFLTTHFHS